MAYVLKDFVTNSELTVDNFIRCLNGYLDRVKILDKDEMEILLLYLDRAMELGGVDLVGAAIDCIRVDLMGR